MSVGKELYKKISKIPILDIHTHVDFQNPFAKNAWQILSYHYFTEMAHSQGMPSEIVESKKISDKEKTEKLSKYLPYMQTTQPYFWLMALSKKLFDFPYSQLSPQNWKVLWECVEKKAKKTNRLREISKLSNIENISTTNLPWENLDGIEKHKNKKGKQFFVPTFRVDSLLTADKTTIKNLEEATCAKISNLEDYEKAISKRLAYFVKKGAKSLATSLNSTPLTIRVEKKQARIIFKKLSKGKSNDSAEFSAYMLDFLSNLCEKNKLPFQLMLGVERNVYSKGVPGGKDVFWPDGNLLGLKYLLNKYPKVKFPISVLSFTEDKELAVYARIFPNVYASGHWWFENTFESIKTNLKNRLRLVPHQKMIGQYSDAYTLELIETKIDMYKRALSDVLEEYVKEKSIDAETAIDIAEDLLYNEPKRIFSL